MTADGLARAAQRGVLDWHPANHRWVARGRVHWARWCSHSLPETLTAVTWAWFRSGYYPNAIDSADAAYDALHNSDSPVDGHEFHRLLCKIAIAGGMAAVHMRNSSVTTDWRDLWEEIVLHWFQILADTDIETLRNVVVPHPNLRDLRATIASFQPDPAYVAQSIIRRGSGTKGWTPA